MANYQDDFFGPIRVPVLKGIDRRDVRDFLERYRKYVIWVTERARLEGAEPQIMQMKMFDKDHSSHPGSMPSLRRHSQERNTSDIRSS